MNHQDSSKFQRASRVLAGACICVGLVGCAYAPGMRYEQQAQDASQPATAARLVPITPNVIASLRGEGDSALSSLQPIIGTAKPYAMGPGDILSLTIWESPQMPSSRTTLGPELTQVVTNETTTVPPGLSIAADGTVQIPYIGSVRVSGMTEAEATQLVTRQLAKFIRNPQVTLRVSAYRSKKVFIEGEVRTPGQVVITDVPMTMAEAIARSGGVTGAADTSNLTLFRQGKSYRINQPLLTKRGIALSSIPLLSEDLLRVAPRDEGRVSVMGEVARPMTLNMRNGYLTLQDALAEAGGVNTVSSDPRQIYVIRNTGAETVPQVYHLSARSPVMLALAENFELRPKDVVFVDPAPLALWNRVISLILPSVSITRTLNGQ